MNFLQKLLFYKFVRFFLQNFYFSKKAFQNFLFKNNFKKPLEFILNNDIYEISQKFDLNR